MTSRSEHYLVHVHILWLTDGENHGSRERDRTLAAYLGYRQIANMARYTEMDAKRLGGFWQHQSGGVTRSGRLKPVGLAHRWC